MAEAPHSARRSKMTDRSFSVASEIVSIATDKTNASSKHYSKKTKSDKGVFKATSHSDTPSLTASIPSKYQTYFTSSNEPRGFNSCAARFNSSHDLVNDNPGPGTYRESQMNRAESFSKKGTGGLASRTKRFPRPRRHTVDQVSPASYYPTKLSSRVDFNKFQVSRNFHLPYVQTTPTHNKGGQGPPPNAYDVNNSSTNKSKNVGGASFKSNSKRTGVLSRATIDNPGPGQYTPNYSSLLPTGCAQTSSFLSTTNRNFLHLKDGPGPADYVPNKKTKKLRPLYFRQKHYLCMSAPAIPLPPIPPPPGPGHYELIKQECPQLVSGAVFKSTSSRWGKPPADRNVPGPGAYDPIQTGKQSFYYNMNHQWV